MPGTAVPVIDNAKSAEPGPIWKHVLATLYAYKSFLAVIAVAWWYRGRRFPRDSGRFGLNNGGA